jgi:hypothetical protein
MGYIRHHAIIVTSWDTYISKAHAKATEIFGKPKSDFHMGPIAAVTPVTDSTVNFYQSFMVAPDGSKEGWDHSDQGDLARAEFIQWLKDDSCCAWAEVQYGDEEGYQRVLDGSNFDSDEEDA